MSAYEPEPDPRPRRRGEGAIVAALITGVLGIVAAIIGGVIATHYSNKSSAQAVVYVSESSRAHNVIQSLQANPAPTVTQTVAVPGPTVSVPGPTTTVFVTVTPGVVPSSANPLIYHQGRINMTSTKWFDLDSRPSDPLFGQTETQSNGVDIGEWNPEYKSFNYIIGVDFADLVNTKGSYAACSDGNLQYGGDAPSGSQIFKGAAFCVRSDQGRLASVTVVNFTQLTLVLDIAVYNNQLP